MLLKRTERSKALDDYVTFFLSDRSQNYRLGFRGLGYNLRKWAHIICKWSNENPAYPWHTTEDMPPHKENVLAARFDYENTEYIMATFNRHSRKFKSLKGEVLDGITHWATMPQIDKLYD